MRRMVVAYGTWPSRQGMQAMLQAMLCRQHAGALYASGIQHINPQARPAITRFQGVRTAAMADRMILVFLRAPPLPRRKCSP